MSSGKALQSHQRALAAADREDRLQQHLAFGKADATAYLAVPQRLEKTEQIACSDIYDDRLIDQGSVTGSSHDIAVVRPHISLLGQTSNRLCSPGELIKAVTSFLNPGR